MFKSVLHRVMRIYGIAKMCFPLAGEIIFFREKWGMAANVWRAEVGGLLKHHLSIRTNVCLKIQMFFSEGK